MDLAALETGFRELEAEAGALMPGRQPPPWCAAASICAIRARITRSRSKSPDSCNAPSTKDDWEARFEALYRSHYGKVDDDNPVELASIRVHVSQPSPALAIARPPATADAAPKAWREVHVQAGSGMERAPVYERAALRVGQGIEGPAVIEEPESTTVIGPGDRLRVDPLGCLVVDLVIQRPAMHGGDGGDAPGPAISGRT